LIKQQENLFLWKYSDPFPIDQLALEVHERGVQPGLWKILDLQNEDKRSDRISMKRWSRF